MRYFIVGNTAYYGSEVALWQIMNTGAPVLEISAEKFAEHKTAYDEFWGSFSDDAYENDPEDCDRQFDQEGLLMISEARENSLRDAWVNEWAYSPAYGLGMVSYQAKAA